MSILLKCTSVSERVIIAEKILKEPKPYGSKIGAHCPFHSEKTPGGSFYYNPEQDYGFCYGCQTGGDLINIYCEIKGYEQGSKEGFKAFFEEFAPNALDSFLQKKNWKKDKESFFEEYEREKRWQAKAALSPEEIWQKKALEFVEDKNKELLGDRELLKMVFKRWRILPQTIERLKIGYVKNEKGEYKAQVAFGLPDEKNEKGKPKVLYFPQGLVVPIFRNGILMRLKIRAENPSENYPRYMALKGGNPSCYAVFGEKKSPFWVITETERDAMYLWQELKDYGFGAMGVGSCKIAPDEEAMKILSRCDLIVNMLDNDEAGSSASWRFQYEPGKFSWNQAFAHVIRIPVLKKWGKDVGDMASNYIEPFEFLKCGLPHFIIKQAEKIHKSIIGE